MKKRSDKKTHNNDIERLMGLGVSSKAKSYYPDLIRKLDELRMEKEKFQSIFHNAQEGIFRATKDGLITDMNPAMIHICCRNTANPCEPNSFYFQSFFKDKFLWVTIISELEQGNSILGLETLLEYPDSTETWISLNLILNTSTEEKIIIEGILEDITERKQAVDELRRTQVYLNNLINSMPSILIGIDTSGKITSMNREAELKSGRGAKEALGKQVVNVFPSYENFFATFLLAPHKSVNQHIVTLLNNDEELHAAITTFPLITDGVEGAVIRIDDITENQKRAEQLQRAQKMQMVGQLAGGIAHDFNNLLTGSIGAVSIMKAMQSRGKLTDNILAKNLDILDSASKRSAEMVTQLLTISKKRITNFTTVDLTAVLPQVLSIFRSSMDKTIELSTSFPDSPAWVEGDVSQLEQVFLNICVNAAHSMTIMRPKGEPWGGKLDISLTHVQTSSHLIQPNGFWTITVHDTGVGIEQKHKDKIFNPFFTTKELGNGTGLGLSMVHSIIEEHDGTIHVESVQDKGTLFVFSLPLASNDQNEEHIDTSLLVSDGEGKVLLIDDEELVRIITSEILLTSGYSPISAENGEEGLNLFNKHQHELRCVLLDMSMPRISGQQVYPKLKEINPNIPVILISGNPGDARVQELINSESIDFLQKPFSFETLAAKLDEVIKR